METFHCQKLKLLQADDCQKGVLTIILYLEISAMALCVTVNTQSHI